MESLWERVIDFYSLSDKEIEKIFYDFNNSNVLLSNTINIGKRNSNYNVITNKGKYLLRICPKDSDGYKNELISYAILKDIINIPKVLCVKDIDNIKYIIYEYIESTNLGAINCNKDIIIKVAKTAALIHNVSAVECQKYDLLSYPSFDTWFDIFLNNTNAIERLGRIRIEKIKKIISTKKEELMIIDKYKGFTHNDYRPENMIIDNSNKLYIVDWEFGNYGHILGDIGQFFRNNENIDDIKIFKEVYDFYSNINLPNNWFSLSKLRDLVNPIQMIGINKETPIRFKGLIKIIDKTIKYFSG